VHPALLALIIFQTGPTGLLGDSLRLQSSYLHFSSIWDHRYEPSCEFGSAGRGHRVCWFLQLRVSGSFAYPRVTGLVIRARGIDVDSLENARQQLKVRQVRARGAGVHGGAPVLQSIGGPAAVEWCSLGSKAGRDCRVAGMRDTTSCLGMGRGIRSSGFQSTVRAKLGLLRVTSFLM
jgi:hypothetical protein